MGRGDTGANVLRNHMPLGHKVMVEKKPENLQSWETLGHIGGLRKVPRNQKRVSRAIRGEMSLPKTVKEDRKDQLVRGRPPKKRLKREQETGEKGRKML